MSEFNNWRPEVDAADFFGNQKKRNQFEDRRPAPKKPGDIPGMGPGIAGAAVRVTNYNDYLATFNGFYSSIRALGGPRPEVSGADVGYDTHRYVGITVSDAVLGGVQRITDIDSGEEFSRRFIRTSGDADFLTWSPWDQLI